MADSEAGPSSGASQPQKVNLSDLAGFSVYPLAWCPHLEALNKPTEYKVDLKTPCKDCNDRKENWICLHCHQIFCSRYVKSHMVDHAESQGHTVTLSFSDLSVWCYGCDDYVDNEILYPFKNAAHREKFGEEMLNPHANSKAVSLTLE